MEENEEEEEEEEKNERELTADNEEKSETENQDQPKHGSRTGTPRGNPGDIHKPSSTSAPPSTSANRTTGDAAKEKSKKKSHEKNNGSNVMISYTKTIKQLQVINLTNQTSSIKTKGTQGRNIPHQKERFQI